MPSVVKVQSLGSFWESVRPSVQEAANRIRQKEQERKRKIDAFTRQNVNQINDMIYGSYQGEELNEMAEIKGILTKAGLGKVFPFKAVKEKDGNITFKPKGKNKEEIQENILKYKEEMKDALDKGKIDREEYMKLEDNLDKLMKENNIELEEENTKVRDSEINDYVNAIIYRQFGNPSTHLPNLEEQYLDANLQEKEKFLNKFNREVNIKLGTNFGWGHENKIIPFENSFNPDGKGYTLSTSEININREDVKEINGDNLKTILYGMVERSLTMKKNLHKTMSPEQLKAMHKTILMDKMKREEQQRAKQEKIEQEQGKKELARKRQLIA